MSVSDQSSFPVFQAKQSISIEAAKKLSVSTNTAPLIPSLSPRWLLHLLPWIDVPSGTYRINRVKYFPDIKKIPVSKNSPFISLRSIQLFKNIPEDLLAVLEKNLHVKKVTAGEKIVVEGSQNSEFYIILEGEFDVSILTKQKRRVTLKTLSEGDYFGEIAALEKTSRQATVTACSDGSLIYLKESAFDKILKDPIIREQLIQACRDRKKELLLINQYGETQAPLISGHTGEPTLPRGFVDYQQNPHEIELSVIQTIIGINTRIDEIYNVPYNQLEQQLRITIENIREREEWEILNNKDFGLLHCVDPSQVIHTRHGAPTPDDLDDLLALTWKRPTFFLAHPKAIAAFGRQCTLRGVPPPTLERFGHPFLTWRGIPLIPTDKLMINYDGEVPCSDILLLRCGVENQGVVALHKANIGSHNIPSLTVKFMGINDHSVASYQLTKYFSAAVLVPDALSLLKNVVIGEYPDDA